MPVDTHTRVCWQIRVFSAAYTCVVVHAPLAGAESKARGVTRGVPGGRFTHTINARGCTFGHKFTHTQKKSAPALLLLLLCTQQPARMSTLYHERITPHDG